MTFDKLCICSSRLHVENTEKDTMVEKRKQVRCFSSRAHRACWEELLESEMWPKLVTVFARQDAGEMSSYHCSSPASCSELQHLPCQPTLWTMNQDMKPPCETLYLLHRAKEQV